MYVNQDSFKYNNTQGDFSPIMGIIFPKMKYIMPLTTAK